MSRYIDADKVLSQLHLNHKDVIYINKNECAKRIEKIPSIDLAELTADRPQGEWVLVEPRYPIEQRVYWSKEQALADTKGNGAIEKRKCSCCGFTKNFMGHMKDKAFKLWNFCPNCGCLMKGASDDKPHKCGRAVTKCT